MDLWIRSQDRERLIKVNTLFVEYNGDVDPTIISYRIVADKCIDLGIYKSKERALEILDEIDKLMSDAVYNGLKVARYEMPKE